MLTQKIFSQNATYQKFEVLRTNRNKRYKYNEFLVEGVRNINEAIRHNWQINAFLYSGGRALSFWAQDCLRTVKTQVNYELMNGLMEELSQKEDSSELLAIVQMRTNEENAIPLAQNPVLALFDRPSNKGNLGTMLRSCDAFGVDGLIITGHAVDVYDPDVISSSMGSFFHVPFLRLSDNGDIDACINDLRFKYPNIQLVGTTAHSALPLRDVDLTAPVLFLIGNETEGLNRRFTETCNVMATIPMSETASASSFNVSCAATVMFYEAVRQRGDGEG